MISITKTAEMRMRTTIFVAVISFNYNKRNSAEKMPQK